MKNWRLFSPAPLELVSRCLDFFFFLFSLFRGTRGLRLRLFGSGGLWGFFFDDEDLCVWVLSCPLRFRVFTV